jgi:DNA-binding IclR family transcriptional regulator
MNYTNQSVERTFAILEILKMAREPASLTDVALAAGLHRATTFRLLSVLTQLGYVHKDQMTNEYSIGCRLHGFGWRSSMIAQISRMAGPYLQRLSGEFSMLAYLSTREEARVVCWAKAGPGGLLPDLHIGVHSDAHATAEGKILLSTRKERELNEIYRDLPMRRHTPQTVANLPALMRELRTSRELGYAIERGERNIRTKAIAVAVPGRGPRPIFAMTLVGDGTRLREELMPAAITRLKQTAHELSLYVVGAPPAGGGEAGPRHVPSPVAEAA